MVPLPFSGGRSTRYSDRLHDCIALLAVDFNADDEPCLSGFLY